MPKLLRNATAFASIFTTLIVVVSLLLVVPTEWAGWLCIVVGTAGTWALLYNVHKFVQEQITLTGSMHGVVDALYEELSKR